MTPRALTDHTTPGNPVNDGIDILVHDEPGPGGANHFYVIDPHNGPRCTIHFQKGTVAEHGVNGITQEALLAVVADRLRSFQAGPYPCRENGNALANIEGALYWLHKRTADRVNRAVEGKMQK